MPYQSRVNSTLLALRILQLLKSGSLSLFCIGRRSGRTHDGMDEVKFDPDN